MTPVDSIPSFPPRRVPRQRGGLLYFGGAFAVLAAAIGGLPLAARVNVEDAHRQLAAAQDSVIAASRHAAPAWVAVARVANSLLPLPETSSS